MTSHLVGIAQLLLGKVQGGHEKVDVLALQTVLVQALSHEPETWMNACLIIED